MFNFLFSLLLTVEKPLEKLIEQGLRLHYYNRSLKYKEIYHRLPERWGKPEESNPPLKRPDGKLIWFHAASVGEMNSILPLMEELLARDELLHILLTTMTVTSAELAQQKLSPRAMHQFLPADLKTPVKRFLRYWKPDAAFLTESEIWPTLIMEIKKTVPVYGIINGRMSEKSFKKWKLIPKGIAALLRGFTIYAQSEKDADRYRALGAQNVSYMGNLKFDAPPLAYDEAALQALQAMVGKRPVWLAASTHPEEESAVINIIHPPLRKLFPNCLTIIVPRHHVRGKSIAAKTKYTVLRSQQEPITDETQFYIADTMGELGLFYRLSKIVFMGGSLIPHGGQNMLEPARLGCAVLWGEHVFNFEDAANMLVRYEVAVQCNHAQDVLFHLSDLLGHPEKVTILGAHARRLMEGQTGITQALADAIMKTMQAKITAL